MTLVLQMLKPGRGRTKGLRRNEKKSTCFANVETRRFDFLLITMQRFEAGRQNRISELNPEIRLSSLRGGFRILQCTSRKEISRTS